MLPPGLAAHPVDAAETAAARRHHPTAQTVAALLVGSCSCDLVRSRHPDRREDERHLRARFARLGLSRDEIIRRLERHRRRPTVPAAGPWPPLLAAFVAEHARNAGPTLFTLRFGDGSASPPPGTQPVTRTVPEVLEHPDRWLDEARPVLVVR